MGVNRYFLGWDTPLCTTVPAWLLAGAGAGSIDFRDTAVVVPTRQASWRLRAALPLAAHQQGATLLGPEIVTAPALLHPPGSPHIASPFQSLLAWCATLREAPPETTAAFLGADHPGSVAWALPLARRLEKLRVELADGALAIRDVPGQGGDVCEEAERWQALEALEQAYLERLKQWGLRDAVAAQLEYARDSAAAPGFERVILAAVPDPPQLLLVLLEQWIAAGTHVDILVAAPPEEAEAFDPWGRPEVADWYDARRIDIPDKDIVLSVNPEDEAGRVASWIAAGMPAQTSAAVNHQPAVAIGVPDTETIAPLQRELAAIGLEAFDPRNRPLQATPLFGLVQALLAWKQSGGAAETAQLLRHPDILAGDPQATAMLAELDRVQAKHLPVTFEHMRRAARADQPLAAALERLAGWRTQLASEHVAGGLRSVLQAIYADRKLYPNEPRDTDFRQAAAALDEALREMADAEAAGQAGPDADAAFVARLQDAAIKPERGQEPLDLEGWLELAWNPAPLMFVAGMNEGMVPDSRLGDLFLPDALRQKLGLRDDRRRTARDAYVLVALLKQRARTGRVVLLAGKSSLTGDPLRPSRLLFRCSDEQLVARARTLTEQPPPVHDAAAFGCSFPLRPFKVAQAQAGLASLLERGISATKFRAYLTCPLRFYLRHILGMEAVDDRTREPDASAFGDLVHNVLEAMAGQDIWQCGNAAELGDWLERELRRQASARYGDQPWLGVSAAVESAARRLHAFAAKQVAWHEAGWDIIDQEADSYRFMIHGVPVVGRIDRVDRNRHDGTVCVLDYKTTDKASVPATVHLAGQGPWSPLPEALVEKAVTQGKRDQRWKDLQLPLYRELVRPAYGPGVKMGYVLLPVTAADTAFALWDDYSPALHTSALACAEAIVAAIQDQRFWPPAPGTVAYDDFSDLLFDEASQFAAPPHGEAEGCT